MDDSANIVLRSGKVLARGSLVIERLNSWDFPDFVDAYASRAKYEDGSDVSDEDLDALTDSPDFYQLKWEAYCGRRTA